MFYKLLIAGLVLCASAERLSEIGSGLDDGSGSGEISSGDVLQDDLIVGPDNSFIHRQFINLGSGNSVEGSFDERDEIIEVVNIKGSNGHRINRTQVVQPGIKASSLANDDFESSGSESSGMPSGTIIEDDLVQGPDGSEVRRVFLNMGSGDSVEGSFDPKDEIVEIDTIKGSNGAVVNRTQVIQQGSSRGRFRRQSTEEDVDGSGSSEEDKQCNAASLCETNDDCNGGSCLGFLPGTCNCVACLEFLPCSTDAQCGGLQSACNTTKGVCECVEAYAKHGYPAFSHLIKLCNLKTCRAGDCLGLPCNKGFCSCPKKTQQ